MGANGREKSILQNELPRFARAAPMAVERGGSTLEGCTSDQ
jgi:hypothetical protein